MRTCVCVMLLMVSAALAGCSSVDPFGSAAGGVFTNGKDPVGPTLAAQASLPAETGLPVQQAENVPSENLPPPPTVIEEATERPAYQRHKTVHRAKSAPPYTARRTPRQATTPAAARAAPAAARSAPATRPPGQKPPAVATTPAKPAAKPATIQTAAPPALKPTPVSAPAKPKRLNSPWPQAPTAGSFSQ